MPCVPSHKNGAVPQCGDGDDNVCIVDTPPCGLGLRFEFPFFFVLTVIVSPTDCIFAAAPAEPAFPAAFRSSVS